MQQLQRHRDLCYSTHLCGEVDFYQLKKSLVNKSAQLSLEKSRNKFLGYYCDVDVDKKLHRIYLLQQVLYRKIISQHYGEYNNVSDALIRDVISRETFGCQQQPLQFVDDSGLNDWIAYNPFCVSKEVWEKFTVTYLDKLNVDLEVLPIEQKCDIVLDIVARNISEELLRLCDLDVELDVSINGVDLDLKAFLNECDISLEAVVKSPESCELDFEAFASRHECDLRISAVSKTINNQCRLELDLLRENTNCDLDFDTYVHLKSCNVSYNLIKSVYENNCTITTSPLQIITPSATIDLNKLKNG